MNTPNNIDEILARHFSGEPLSDEARQALEAYKADNEEEYRKVETILENMPDEAPSMDVDTDRAWENVEARLSPPASRSLLRRLYPVLAVAASLLLLVGIGLWATRVLGSDGSVRYANDGSRDTSIVLPDGSRMVLSPLASAEYRVENGNRQRRVELQGKAFFDVNHNGQAFRVGAGDLLVDVLGTAFTVDATNDDHGHVTVKSGRVQVSTGKQTIVLVQGEQVSVDNGTISHKQKTQPEALKPHSFHFDNTLIGDAAAEVGKALDVEIEVDARIAADNRVTTHMEVTTPMQALREFALLCGCRYDSISPLKYRLRR
ncbi:MAG: FecR domain-containing protein [Prevotella sp.]|nr:FecR domain-containing protein [Prevotella sp.]